MTGLAENQKTKKTSTETEKSSGPISARVHLDPQCRTRPTSARPISVSAQLGLGPPRPVLKHHLSESQLEMKTNVNALKTPRGQASKSKQKVRHWYNPPAIHPTGARAPPEGSSSNANPSERDTTNGPKFIPQKKCEEQTRDLSGVRILVPR